MLLTGAPLALIVSLAAVEPRLVEEWLTDDGPLQVAITALHRDIPAPLRARLRVLVQREIGASDALPHDASARASLVLVRALGCLDAERHLLEHSALRQEAWSGDAS